MTEPGSIRADDHRLRWVGRVPTAADGCRTLIWSGTELRARFHGTALSLRLAHHSGGICHLGLELDGQTRPLQVSPGPTVQETRLTGLGPGPHTLRLRKRTEASQACAQLLGLTLGPGATGHWLAPPPARSRRFIFYGDSITAGACLADPGDDQYEDLSTHDGTQAYGALTAERFEADYLGHAVSGVGVTATWERWLMPQVFDRLWPDPGAPAAPPEMDGEPDLVFLNLGQNDHGFPASQGRRLAGDFAPRYLALVRQLRQRHPRAGLLLLLGGMSAWRDEPALPAALQAACRRLHDEGDTRVWTHVFQACAPAHPRQPVHQRMADELCDLLQTQLHLNPVRPAACGR